MHTPEPWIVRPLPKDRQSPYGLFAFVIAGGSLETVATNIAFVPRTPKVEPTRQPDADRIVACVNGCAGITDPSAVADMREALEGALRSIEFERHPFRPWHDEARAALAKAGGRA